MDSREYLTGCALIALALDRNTTLSAADSATMLRALNRLNAPSDHRNLERHVQRDETQSRHQMASMAVALADACMSELEYQQTIYEDPFQDQDS